MYNNALYNPKYLQGKNLNVADKQLVNVAGNSLEPEETS